MNGGILRQTEVAIVGSDTMGSYIRPSVNQTEAIRIDKYKVEQSTIKITVDVNNVTDPSKIAIKLKELMSENIEVRG